MKEQRRQVRGIVPDQFLLEASEKTDNSALRFATLLSIYPEFCQLKKLEATKQGSALFVMLMYQMEALINAFKRKQLSARYISGTAIVSPHFITNLLAHLHLLSDLTHTLEIDKKQQEYFSRITVLVKGNEVSPKALLAYSQAFTHLVLLINEGQSEALLDRYSRIVSNMGEDEFAAFLELDQLSTDGIQGFISGFESSTQDGCRWYYFAHEYSQGYLVCGNTTFARPINASSAQQY